MTNKKTPELKIPVNPGAGVQVDWECHGRLNTGFRILKVDDAHIGSGSRRSHVLKDSSQRLESKTDQPDAFRKAVFTG